MIAPQKPYAFRSKLLERLSHAFGCGLLFFWFAWGAVVWSWAGHRPFVATPATGQVIPYNNHGLMFVSKTDLNFSHLLLALAALCGVVAWAFYLADKKPWTKQISN